MANSADIRYKGREGARDWHLVSLLSSFGSPRRPGRLRWLKHYFFQLYQSPQFPYHGNNDDDNGVLYTPFWGTLVV
jgi:hypothetical protein